ncbi:Coenzyme F420 hydrogenase/dehydrogenase, beta subunit C-terminal domain [Marimonas lutisalis]|uniref:Coenzyme F420 hydrogenase/dehydrogenase, beta subunit C-terminal domain n=1 Tax=Marimonas lutisalis TaxID=2545756 RepID=UPI0010F9A233|nr:Coenzyme F420 hydrogenase/dehydrogenase, beta subunit C-terminal domain [Marimonas lutisalis]
MPHSFRTLEDIIDNGFCIGCGLCKALAPGAVITMVESENGHLRPRASNPIQTEQEAAIMRLCPGINIHGPFGKTMGDADPVWGAVKRVARGHAADPDTRFRAAAGGIMTALSQFLVESGRVSKVLQVRADPENAVASRPVANRDAESVLASSGSRYATCATLERLPDILAEGEPIAVAMKPCDIAAIRNLQAENERARKLIVCTIALFCGTVPSLEASDDFLARRGLTRNDIVEFRWRGHGCPGPTYARTADGREFEGAYREFWVDNHWTTQFRCKICPDAVGLQADIATGDAWPGGWPKGEDDGWNMLIAHTEVGEHLLADCEAAGKIWLEDSDIEFVSDTQPHHVSLRRALAARLAAGRIAGLPEPNFSDLGLNACAAGLDPDTLAKNFAGTLRRIRAGQGDEAVKADYAD